ncbi:FtsX-like permease family protein [Thaumasiovibrio sp. DFM-14]|uniref:ABC transporter permease n=1 Tax=Thaumasiovibrio sp. DFM-14 TaxID=3384792 RepID=UPI0039A2782E
MFVPVANAVWGHYTKHRLQLVLVWLGLTLGISLLVGVLAINYQARTSYQLNKQLLSNPFPYFVINKQLGERVQDSAYITLRRNGFSKCVPLERAVVTTSQDQVLEIMGIDTVAMLNLDSSSFSDAELSRFTRHPDSILISQSYAILLGISNDQMVETDYGPIGPFRLVGDRLLGGARLMADIGLVKGLNNSPGLSAIACGAMSDNQLQRLSKILPNHLRMDGRQTDDLSPLTRAFHRNLLAMGLLAFIVGMFIFFQAMSLSFTQRQPLIGQLRQLGVGGRQLTSVLVVEVLIWLVVAVLSGNMFGLLLANVLMPSVALTLSDLYGAVVPHQVEWHWQWGLVSVLVAVTGTACACAWPMVRLIRTPPSRLSRHLSLFRATRREFRVQALFACILAVIAYAIYQLPPREWSGLAVIGLILLSAALLMPFLVWRLFFFLALILRTPKLRWFFTDAAASLSYRGVAAMAFMLALAANIGMDTMVGSFRHATLEWLQTRIAADIYIRPQVDEVQSISYWLQQRDDVDSVYWRWSTEFNSEQGALQAASIGTSSEERESLTMKVSVPNYWFEFHTGQGILVSESLALKRNWVPGQRVHLPEPFKGEWRVAGIYYDYGNPYGQVMLPHKRWRQLYANQGRVGLAAKITADADPNLLENLLLERFSLRDDQVANQQTLLNESMWIFEQTFKVTDALGLLTLVIAVSGLFFATTAGELSRAKQFALLRCMGLSGKELVIIGGGQLMVLGLLTATFALPLGITVAHLLIDRILRHSFGWTMELVLFPSQYVIILGISLVALMLAGGWPVLRLIRRSAMRSFREAL